MRVQSLGQERGGRGGPGNPLWYLDWRIPWTEEPGGPGGPGGLAESDTTEATLHIHVE